MEFHLYGIIDITIFNIAITLIMYINRITTFTLFPIITLTLLNFLSVKCINNNVAILLTVIIHLILINMGI